MSAGESLTAKARAALRLALHLSRLALLVVCATSAAISLLAFVPATNRALIATGDPRWISAFSWMQPWLFLLASVAVIATTLPRWSLGRSNAWSAMTALSLSGFALWMIVAQPLRDTGLDPAALTRGVLMLVPLALVGFFDVLDASRRVIWTSSRGAESGRQFLTVVAAGVLVAVVFFFSAFSQAGGEGPRGGDLLALGVTSLWLQLVVGAALFIGLAFARAAAAFFYRSAFWEAVFILVGGGLALAGTLVLVVFRSLGVGRADAWTIALAGAACLALLVYGTAVRDRANHAAPEIESGVDIVVAGLGVVPGAGWRGRVTALLAAAGGLWLSAVAVAPFDRGLVLQQLLAVAAWLAFVAILYRLIPARETAPDATIVWLEICVLLLAGLFLVDRWGGDLARAAGGGDLARAEGHWRTLDAAYRLGRNGATLGHRFVEDPIYAHLREQDSQAVYSGNVRPPSLAPDERAGATAGRPPDIVLIAIDGLRRETGAVVAGAPSLTPEIDNLALEGTSFRNAFSRYGERAAAGASIWFGGMALHESRVEPFHDVNALQRLLEAGGYRQFVSGLESDGAVVSDGKLVTKVEAAEGSDDVCARLESLRAAIDPHAGGADPVFAYASGTVIAGAESASGSKNGDDVETGVRRADACLGRFLDFFRSKGTWESSIVIVTARHGSSPSRELASSLAPENLRVPLVVKLPRDLRDAYRADADAIAFNSDITPTLYYLAGQRPVRNSDVLGRPLFTQDLAEQLPYLRGEYLVASGLGPVYGILVENGNRLYVADAVEGGDVVYDMPPGKEPASRAPAEGERRRARELLRERLGAIARAFGLAP